MKKNLTDEQEVADLIHKKTCHWNHTDGCGWFYGNWDSNPLGYERKEYLEKAKKMLFHAKKETIINILNCL